MTVTTGLRDHDPVTAAGKSNEHTGVSGTEGDTSFSFDNTSNTIDVDDLVFCSDQDDDAVQYLGLCTVDSGAGGITVQHVLQETPGTSLKIWEPTSAWRAQYRIALGGEVPTDSEGVIVTPTRGNDYFTAQMADASKSVALTFNPVAPRDYNLWQTFRSTRVLSTTPSFALAYWSRQAQLSVTQQVVADGGQHSAVQIDEYVTAFSQRFFIKADDTYVDP